MMRATGIMVASLMIAGCSQAPEAIDNDATVATTAPAVPDVKPGPHTLFVNVERVQRRTCPNITCGDVGWIAERQVVEALEQRNDWVRITKPYDASCKNGVSEYVDAGKNTCTADNGITDGRFAEWVPMSALSKERPTDPAATATGNEALVAQSDDFKRYHEAFTEVATKLIAEGRCTTSDFQEQGGWMKSVNQYKDEPVYFTYCGGMTSANKIYMNASSRKVL